MKNLRRTLPWVLALALALTACDSGGREAGQGASAANSDLSPAPAKAPESAGRNAPADPSPVASLPLPPAAQAPAPQSPAPDQGASAEPAAEAPAPDPAELERADRAVAFYNGAVGALGSGRYVQADMLMLFAERYLQEWRLASLPAVTGEEHSALARKLAPPAQLFSPGEEKTLVSQVDAMNTALASMRADYRALERYVNDHAIQDDGVKGGHLVSSLRKGHTAFAAARDQYLATVEARAAAAGELLLRGHPLKRQLQAAERVFVLFRKTAGLLTPEKPDREALAALRAELAGLLARAGRPPFMATPDVERAFRFFLKQAGHYEELLGHGLAEGFYSPLRQSMNAAALDSRAAYNAFVGAANRP